MLKPHFAATSAIFMSIKVPRYTCLDETTDLELLQVKPLRQQYAEADTIIVEGYDG